MRITELLDKRSISLTAAPASKSEALDMAVDLMAASGKIRDKEAYRKEVYLREEESTTGVGGGIAIPHGKCDAVEKPGLAAMVIKDGVDFDSLDGEPVNLIFLIAAPNTKDNIHLDVLSKLSILLMDEQFSENLKKHPHRKNSFRSSMRRMKRNRMSMNSWRHRRSPNRRKRHAGFWQ